LQQTATNLSFLLDNVQNYVRINQALNA